MLKKMCVWAVLFILPTTVTFGQDFGVDPFSPEVPMTFSPADIVAQGGGGVLIPSTWMGLLPSDNVDGFSYGSDILTPLTPGNPLAVRFSVSRATMGAPGTAVNMEAAGNGAAGDIFWGFITPGGAAQGPWLWQDATVVGLTPLPGQSDINGVTGLNGGAAPLTSYFSVDPATAARLGVTASDILYQSAVGPGAPPPVVYASQTTIGLAPGDDVDAVAVIEIITPGTYGMGDIIFFSLAPGSPSLSALAATPGSIMQVTVFAPPFVTITAGQAGLQATDDLNAVTCYNIACCIVTGDANHDGMANVADAVFLINYVFSGGGPPVCPNEADANGDGAINVADVVYIINFVFRGGPAPITGTVY